MDKAQLIATANAIVENGKGILAADESFPTIGKRFDSINIENTEPNRQAYRQMLFTTEGANEFVGGVILFDETLRQNATDGRRLADILAEQGIIPGIKVDKGAKPLVGHEGETITEGLDGLRDRMAEYYDLGARFAKWRAVITIKGDELPSEYCLQANADALARYAAICQDANIVPIVEPEVIMDGAHSIERCEAVTTNALNKLFAALKAAGVLLEGTLLKPNMVISGTENERQADAAEVAEATVRVLKACVPDEIPGVVFLSGGQNDVLATEHLHLMNANNELPWKLSFSYGRALQDAALKTWKGEAGNVDAGKAAYFKRAKLNWQAANGQYEGEGA